MIKKTFCTMGPFPIELVAEVVAQTEKKGWTVRFVVFSGMIAPKIAIPGQPPAVPCYAVISYTEHDEQTKPVPPKIEIPGMAPRAAAEEKTGPRP